MTACAMSTDSGVRLAAAIVVSLLATAGCRNDPYVNSYVDSINAQQRVLEDQLYDLKYDYQVKVRELEQCRRQLAALEGTGSSTGATGRPRRPLLESPRREPAPRTTPGNEIPDLQPPTVSPGTPVEPKTNGKEQPPAANRDRPPAEKGPGQASRDTGGPPADGAGQPGIAVQLEPPDRTPADRPGVSGSAAGDTEPAAGMSARWTPRAAHLRRDTASENVARNPAASRMPATEAAVPDPAAESTRPPDTGPAGGGWRPSNSSLDPDTAPRQAGRPVWRPYR